MANMWGVRFNNADFYRNLAQDMANLKRDAEREAERQAKSFARIAKKNAPRGEGPVHIADTIVVERGDTAKGEWVVKIGSADAAYAAPLEFGHVTEGGTVVHGKRWWTPAKKIINRRWKAAMRRVARRSFKRFT